MKIRFLYGSNSQPYETTLNEEDPISQLKSLIATHIGLEPDLQKWVYKGKILSEHQRSLLSYEFCDGDTIHVIKSISKPSSSPPPSLSSTTSSSPAGSSYPVPYFDQAMGLYLTHNSHEDNVKNCLSTISKILSNIIDHPHEEKYRRIKNTNPHFQKKVGSQEGSQQLLQSLGFNLQGEEWILYPNAETWNTIVSCQQKLQKFLEKLTSSATIASPPPPSSSPSSSASSSKGVEPSVMSPPPPPSAPQDASAPSLDPQTLIALQSLASLLSLQAANSSSTPQAASDPTSPEPPSDQNEDRKPSSSS